MFKLGILSFMARTAAGPRCIRAMLRGRSPDIMFSDCTPMSAHESRRELKLKCALKIGVFFWYP